MSVLLCQCGFSCGTRSALNKHLSKNADSSGHGVTEFTKKLMELSDQFTKFDKSGDHMLDLAELTALLKRGKMQDRRKSLTDWEIRRLFIAADTDGDDLISFDEFLGHIFAPATGDLEALDKHSCRGRAETEPPRATTAPTVRRPPRPRPGSGTRRARPAPQAPSIPEDWHIVAPVTRPFSQPPDQSSSTLRGTASDHLSSTLRSTAPDPFSSTLRSTAPDPFSSTLRSTASDQFSSTLTSFSSTPSSGRRPRIVSEDLVMLGSDSPDRLGGSQLDGMIRLLIIRHGKSANKARARGEAASSDPELSEQGYEQAEALGRRLAVDLKRIKPGDLIIASSPMARCLLTIRPAVYRLNLAPGDCICHGGCYEFGCAGLKNPGTPVDVIGANFPEFSPVCFRSDGSWEYLGSSDKETEEEARARGIRIVDWIWEVARTLQARPGNPRAKVFVLSIHQTMADLICQLLLDRNAGMWGYGDMRYKLNNTAITEIVLQSNGRAVAGKQNDFSHLRDYASPNISPSTSNDTMTSRTPKLIAQLRAKFSQIDERGDHKLSLEQMSALLRRGDPNLSDAELHELFRSADTTKDGRIDFDEFLDFIFRQEECGISRGGY